MTRICLLASLIALLFAVPAWGANPADPEDWDAGTYEINPEPTDTASQGDDHIRDVKIQVRRRSAVEHQFGIHADVDATASDDNGLHRMGSARCFVKDDAPTALEMEAYDNTTGAGLVAGEQLDTISSALICNPQVSDCSDLLEYVGNGRCWFDRDGADNIDDTPDDYTLYVYDDKTAAVGTPDALAQWELADRGSSMGENLLTNGDFDMLPEEADGETCVDADSDGVCDAPLTGADAYPGWTDDADMQLTSYQATDFSEGTGYSMTLTAGSNADTLSQALVLKGGSRTYAVVARVLPTAGGDTCVLDQSGAASEVFFPVTSPAAAAWTTLYGEFTTAAGALDTVTITIGATLATDVCEWDHVAVYEVNPDVIPLAGDFVSVQELATDLDLCDIGVGNNCALDVDIIESAVFIAPAPGCFVDAQAQVSTIMNNAGLLDTVDFQGLFVIQVDIDGAGYNTVSATDVDYQMANSLTLVPVTQIADSHYLRAVSNAVTAGATYQFKLMWDGTVMGNIPDAFDVQGTSAPAQLFVEFNCPE